MEPRKIAAIVVGAAVMLGLILFPIYAEPKRYNGLLVDENGNPMPDTEITVTDFFGEHSSKTRTTSGGRFYSAMSRHAPAKVVGYELTRLIRSSGGTDRYVYSPPANLKLCFVDEQGRPVKARASLQIGPDNNSTTATFESTEMFFDRVPSAMTHRRGFVLTLQDGSQLKEIEKTFGKTRMELKAVIYKPSASHGGK